MVTNMLGTKRWNHIEMWSIQVDIFLYIRLTRRLNACALSNTSIGVR